MDWLDSYPDPSYKAAHVVTNLWLAAFAVTSALFGLLGAVVALQWPNPRILCYKTSYSDMPSSSLRSCCSLYSLNLGFTVFWLLVFAIMVIARDVVRIIVCLCFCLVHVAVVVVFRLKFRRYGRPERPYSASADMAASASSVSAGVQPGTAVGIPVYSIPLQTVVIGSEASPTAAGAAGNGGARLGGAGAGAGPGQWYDAACYVPQQPGMSPRAAELQQGAAPFAYPYPPQGSSQVFGAPAPAPPLGPVAGQPVAGLLAPPAGVLAPPPAMPAGTAAAASGQPAGGAAGAAAGAAAAAGAGATGSAARERGW